MIYWNLEHWCDLCPRQGGGGRRGEEGDRLFTKRWKMGVFFSSLPPNGVISSNDAPGLPRVVSLLCYSIASDFFVLERKYLR